MAALIDNSRGGVFCGATIITETYVLTAAHCVVNMTTRSISVLVGDHDISVGMLYTYTPKTLFVCHSMIVIVDLYIKNL